MPGMWRRCRAEAWKREAGGLLEAWWLEAWKRPPGEEEALLAGAPVGAGQVGDEEEVELGDAVSSSLNGHIKVNRLYLEDVELGPDDGC